MSCERTETVLHGYIDNELDALGARNLSAIWPSASTVPRRSRD